MDLNDLKDVKCSKCNNLEFIQTFVFKVVPAVMSQSGKEQVAPVPARFVCAQCGTDVYETIQLLEGNKEESKIIL